MLSRIPMNRSLNIFFWIVGVVMTTAIIHISRTNFNKNIDFLVTLNNVDDPEDLLVGDSCECRDSNRVAYDFCYKLPANNSMKGQRFACSNLPIMKDLGLIDYNKEELFNFEKQVLDPIFVTAFSQNHAPEGERLISLINNYFPKKQIILYDLGLQDYQIAKYKKACNVQLRSFNFKKYGPRVGRLREYRWKPIIIAETLKEFGAIFYMDSSVVFSTGNISHVYDLLRCHANNNESHIVAPSTERDKRENATKIEDGWDREQWQKNKAECQKAAYLLHSYTSHGIYPVTNPGVYNFIPTDFDEIRKPKAKMYEAGFALVVRTEDVIEDILKWYVLCALDVRCMAPPGSQLGCSFQPDRFAVYANCHRFDQSVVNLLLANRYYYDRHFYSSEIAGFFKIMREGYLVNSDLVCPSSQT